MIEYERLTFDSIESPFKISSEKREITKYYKYHWHEFYEIELIISGSGIYKINGVSHEIREPCIFFLTPADLHSVAPAKASSLELINVMFDGNMADKELLYSLMNLQSRKFNLSDGAFSEIKILCTLLANECLPNKKFKKIYMKYLLNCVIINIVRCGKGDCSRTVLPCVQQAVFYIQMHFKENLSLSDLSRNIRLSPNYLSEIFRIQTGKTFKQFITAERMSYAAKLLEFSELPITRICYESGYEDFSSFSRAFKKHFGMSAGKFRELRKAKQCSQK